MKNLLKRTCVLLLVFAMFMSMCSNVFATKLMDGDNGEEIYLSWSYYKYDTASDSMVAVSQLDSTDDIYFARLSYSNNPSDVTKVMRSFDLLGEINSDIVTGITGEANFSKVAGSEGVDYTFAANYKDGLLFVTGATASGFVKTNLVGTTTSVTSAGLFNVRFQIKKAVSEDELKTLFKVAVNEKSFIYDVNGKRFTIIELPHFTARVKNGADTFYTSSTADTIAANLTGELIAVDGTKTTVDSGITVTFKEALKEGINTVTASYQGYTCDVQITVEKDNIESIAVSGTPKLVYTSGEALDLTGLVVTATYESKATKVLGAGEYETVPAAGTVLTVKDNDKQTLTVTVPGVQSVDVGTLTVNPIDIGSADVQNVGTDWTYTGEEIKPTPDVRFDGELLTKDVDYELSYRYNINATQESGDRPTIIITGKGEYTGFTTVYFTINKAKGELTLKVANQEPIAYGDTLAFTDGNDKALNTSTTIYYKTNTETTGTVFDDKVWLDAGTYTFWAVRPGDDNNEQATSNEVTVTINQKDISGLTFEEIADQTYTGSALTPDLTIKHGTKTLTAADYDVTYSSNIAVGTATATVTGKGNYTGEKTVNFRIVGKNLDDISDYFTSIKNLPAVEYKGEQWKPAVTEKEIMVVTADGTYTLTDADYVVEYGENTNAGTNAGSITIKPAEGSNYTFDEFTVYFNITKVKITVEKADLTMQPSPESSFDGTLSDGTPYFTYDTEEHTVTLFFQDNRNLEGGPKRYNGKALSELLNISSNVSSETNVGTYTITPAISLKDADNYELEVIDAPLSFTWKIEKADVTGDAPALNVLCSEVVGTDPRDYDYSLRWLSVAPAAVSTKLDGGFACTGANYKGKETKLLEITGVTAKLSTVTGDYFTLTLDFGDNYNVREVKVPVNYINKKTVELTMADVTAVYGNDYAPVVLLDGTDVTKDCTITYSPANPKNVGEYEITAKYEDNIPQEGGYPGRIGEVKAKLTITAKPLTITVTPAEITYGDAAPSDYKVDIDGLAYNEAAPDFTVTTNYTKGDNAGSYTITVKINSNQNYTGTGTGVLTVKPKTLTDAMVTVTTNNETYDGTEKKPDVTVTDGTALTKDTDYTLSYSNNINAGTDTAKVIVTGTGNYTGTIEKTFSIAKAQPMLSITSAADADYTGTPYDETKIVVVNLMNVSLTYEYYSDAACKTPASPVDAGTYYVKVTFAGDGNHEPAESNAVSFTINKATLYPTISAADVDYTGSAYSDSNITVSTTGIAVSFEYFNNKDCANEHKLTSAPVDAGTYWVKATFTDSNYNDASATDSFQIKPATPAAPTEIKVDNGDTTLGELGDSMEDEMKKRGVPGTITWFDSDGKPLGNDTKVEPNTEYTWVFTPASGNYSEIRGKTTPYVRSDLSWLPGVINGGSKFTFRDVTRYDYFYDAVKWAAENGVASGTSSTTFSPDAVCTRAQTVTFLWRAAGSPAPSYRACPFTDVHSYDYYYEAVLWAVEQGITNGLTATTFGPDETVTRGQVATFLYRAASAAKPNTFNPFTDVKPTAYNYDAILWAYDNRITTGTSTTTFSPDAFCTRAQIVTFLYRFYQGR